MTFTEALQYMLKGSRIRRAIWPKKSYIKFSDSGGMVINELSHYYHFYRGDYGDDWEIYNDFHEGTILHRYDGNFAVVLNTHGKYAIVNTSTWKILLDGMDQDGLNKCVDNLNFEIVS